MEKSELESKAKALKELLLKMEEIIPDDASNDDVMNCVCVLLGKMFIGLREKGIDEYTFMAFTKRKISKAILAVEQNL